MPDNKSISQLTTAEQTTSSDLFETSIPNGSLGYLSRKVSLDAIAQFIAKALQYSDLQTEAKTLIDAINEAASGGGGGASIEEMTQAQYNALTPEQKADGTLRAISDATTSISDIDDVNITSVADGDVLAYDSTSSKWVNKELEADAIAYDNTSSGLTATDVNSAIDEVKGDIDEINTTANPLFVLKTYSYTEASVAENAGLNISKADFGISDIDGYTPIVINRISVSRVGYIITTFNAMGSGVILSVRNNTNAAITDTTFTVRIVFVKSNFLKELT